MRIQYYPDTDSLYIDLASLPSVDSREVTEGVVLDYDAKGQLTGIDIEHASRKLDISELVIAQLPGEIRLQPSQLEV